MSDTGYIDNTDFVCFDESLKDKPVGICIEVPENKQRILKQYSVKDALDLAFSITKFCVLAASQSIPESALQHKFGCQDLDAVINALESRLAFPDGYFWIAITSKAWLDLRKNEQFRQEITCSNVGYIYKNSKLIPIPSQSELKQETDRIGYVFSPEQLNEESDYISQFREFVLSGKKSDDLLACEILFTQTV
jgi:hypothetical protein